MRKKLAVMAVLTAVGIAAGCGTEQADSKQTVQTETDAQKNADSSQTETTDKESEEKTEVRREKYDDCDGSGHGYVEIYYSDGSMETEEYQKYK